MCSRLYRDCRASLQNGKRQNITQVCPGVRARTDPGQSTWGVAGGHYAGHDTTQKIAHAGLWWPTLYQDSKAYCGTCDVCQWTGKPSRRDEMPLKPQLTLQQFEKWAINFAGPIAPRGNMSAHYIIIAIEYLTRWAKA